MRRGPILLALGLVASLVVTAGLWLAGLPGLFLFLPFLFAWPLLQGRRRQEARGCPACGHRPVDPGARYCPRDGTRLPET